MADKPAVEGTSSGQPTSESSESSIEINIKTLNSQHYTFRVDKHMPVSMLKEKIAGASGIPIGQQRLIYQGKVLKDEHQLSEYQLEDGHALHLVQRQHVQAQDSSSASSHETARNNVNQGHDSTTPPNRIAQVSHSVVLGTVNLADQREGVGADIGRLVGAVLSSLGAGASNISTATASNQVPGSVETGSRNTSVRTQTGNLAQPGVAILNHPIQFIPQIPQSAQMVSPSGATVIPDSLTTLSEFISRMDLALQNSGPQPSPSPLNLREPPTSDLPSLNQRVPTPEVLGATIEHARQLLSGNAATALSHIAARLEREGTSTDPVVRGQIQTEAMHVGRAMQHLGAMLLELGRTTMTLRMGQSPAESWVNAGPAVYISSTGPNSIMVQPFPLQTSSLFSAPAPIVSGLPGPFGTVDPSRNVNIHIHTVAPGVSSAGNRANSGVPTHGERTTMDHASTNGNSSGSAQSSTASNGAQPSTAIPGPNPSGSDTISTLVAHRNAWIVSALAGNSQGQISTSSTDSQDSHPTTSIGAQIDSVSQSQDIPSQVDTIAALCAADGRSSNSYTDTSHTREAEIVPSGNSAVSCQVQDEAAAGADKSHKEADIGLPKNDGQQLQSEASKSSIGVNLSTTISQPGDTPSSKSIASLIGPASQSSQGLRETNQPAPLGLGPGALQPMRRGKTAKADVSHNMPSGSRSQQSISRGQRVLQSLVSQSSDTNRGGNGSSGPSPSSGEVDISSMMSQVLQSPVMDNLLTGVAQQAGVGSPANLRNILEQCTQSPAINNMMHNFVQQVEGQGQGGIDFSGMIQQMMPVVSQALGGGSIHSRPVHTTEPQAQGSNDMIGRDGVLQCRDAQVEAEGQNLGSTLRGMVGQSGIDVSSMFQQMIPMMSQVLGRGSVHSATAHDVECHPQPLGNDGKADRDGVLKTCNAETDLQRVVERIGEGDSPGNVFRAELESAAHLHGEGNGDRDLVEELGNNIELIDEFKEMLLNQIRQKLQTQSSSKDKL